MIEDLEIPKSVNQEPDLAIPSIEEQQRIVVELKRLEDAGELTPEILEAFLTGKRSAGSAE